MSGPEIIGWCAALVVFGFVAGYMIAENIYTPDRRLSVGCCVGAVMMGVAVGCTAWVPVAGVASVIHNLSA